MTTPQPSNQSDAGVSRMAIVRHYGKDSLAVLALMAVISLVDVGLSLLQPWPTKIVIDSVFGFQSAPWVLAGYTHTEHLLALMVAAFVILYALQQLSAYLSMRIGAWANFRIDSRTRADMFSTIMALPLQHKKFRTGEYDFRLNEDARAVADRILGVRITLFQSVVALTLAFMVLWRLNWQLTMIALIAVPILLWSIAYFTGLIEASARQLRESLSATRAFTTESIGQTQLIQTFVKETERTQKFFGLMKDNYHAGLGYRRLGFRFGLTNGLSSLISYAGLLLIGGEMVFHGRLTIGELIIFFSYAGMLTAPLQSITGTVTNIKTLGVSIDRVQTVFNQLQTSIRGLRLQTSHLPRPLRGEVSYRGVSVSYDGEVVAHDVNFTVKPGEKLALVGPSGSGKSTLLNVLLGFVRPSEGTVLIDGTDISSVPVQEVREVLSLVEQDAQLLNMTIDENIAFGLQQTANLGSRQQDIAQAALEANAFRFVMKLPNNFQTMAGDRGSNLSGGQRQRIAIARALARNTPIILLDEPTSALDDKSADAVVTAVTKLIQNKTVLMVTHNLELLNKMDRILVVDKGTVADITDYGGLDAYRQSLKGVQS